KIDCIGGFKLEEPDSGISYNHIFDDLISKNSTIFHIELSKVIEDSKIELIKNNFTQFIEKQRIDLKLLEEDISYNE
ncbi:MAG: hypothetical protein JW891_02850, partial [Candidatus Lokiarchaeota archaeon]|nr:hypothetical protein [Candidatus Lokiarchaeota archaeon]